MWVPRSDRKRLRAGDLLEVEGWWLSTTPSRGQTSKSSGATRPRESAACTAARLWDRSERPRHRGPHRPCREHGVQACNWLMPKAWRFGARRASHTLRAATRRVERPEVRKAKVPLSKPDPRGEWAVPG